MMFGIRGTTSFKNTSKCHGKNTSIGIHGNYFICFLFDIIFKRLNYSDIIILFPDDDVVSNNSHEK